jgi:uncharacterized LabA/DUF88 family protein
MKRIAIFIDGNNFYYGLRNIYGKFKSLKLFNFEKFTNYIAENNEIVGIYYYNAQLDKTLDLNKYNSQKEFFDKLKAIPKLNLVLCKLLKRKLLGTDKYYYVLKEDDIHMAVDIVEGACEDWYDIALVISGDGDFVPAIKSVQRKEKLVKNIYFKFNASRNLKSTCHSSFEITKEFLDKFFEIGGEGK